MVKHTFPLDSLPQPVAAYIDDLAQSLNVSADLIAPIALTEAAAAIGGSREIQVRPGWTELPVLWSAAVAAPGQMKSPTQSSVLRPIRSWQAHRFHDFEVAHQAWQLDMAHWQDLPKRDRGDAPQRPAVQRAVVSDVTIEALAPILNENPRGVLVDVDELSGWTRGMGQYKSGGHGADRSKWLEMWPSQPITVDRKSADVPIHVRRPVVSIVGGIQPRVLTDIEDGRPGEDGMLDRFLFTVPPETDGRWSDRETDPSLSQEWEQIILTLLGLRMAENGIGPEPQRLALDDEARQTFAKLNDDHADETRDPSLPARLLNPYSKLRGYAARLALIAYEMHQACGQDVSWPYAVCVGWEWADWFKTQAHKAYGLIEETTEDRVVQLAVRFLRNHGGECSVRDIVRANLAGIRKSSDAELLANLLEDRGLATITDIPTGARPRRVVRLIEEVA